MRRRCESARCGWCSPIRANTPRSGRRFVRFGEKFGCAAETLRLWVRQSERDQGDRSGLTTDQLEELKTLRRENRELRRANEILRKASAYFAQAELDRPSEAMTAFVDQHRKAYGVEPICAQLPMRPFHLSASTNAASASRSGARRVRAGTPNWVRRSGGFTKRTMGCTAPVRCGGSCTARESGWRGAQWSV